MVAHLLSVLCLKRAFIFQNSLFKVFILFDILIIKFCHVGLDDKLPLLRICSTGSLDIWALEEDADLAECALIGCDLLLRQTFVSLLKLKIYFPSVCAIKFTFKQLISEHWDVAVRANIIVNFYLYLRNSCVLVMISNNKGLFQHLKWMGALDGVVYD